MSSSNEAFRDPELFGLEEAADRLGRPVHRLLQLPPLPEDERNPFRKERAGEVLMVLPRPEGLLLHSKEFYPDQLLRLPTGGLKRRETALAGAKREVLEETGLALEPIRFLFHIVHLHGPADARARFHSLGFLFPATSDPVFPIDPDERITVLQGFPWTALDDVIRKLEGLKQGWGFWGRFRAVSHRLLQEIRRDHPEWF